MHERSLVAAILAQVTELAEQEQACAVQVVHIRVGAFAGVDAELFRLALADTPKSPLFATTVYDLIETPLIATCCHCSRRFEVANHSFRCPLCCSSEVEIVDGDAVILEDVELLLPST